MGFDHYADLKTLKMTFDSSDEAAVYFDAITTRLSVSAISLLDIGVGAGISTIRLMHALQSKEYSVELTMVDPAVPEDRKETLQLHGHLFETRLEHFVPGRLFDVVIATQVLYFLGDLRQALCRLAALVRPGGGLLALTTWTENCVLFDLYNRVFRSDRPCFTAEEAQRLLAQIAGRVPTLVRSSGVIRTSMWKHDESVCRASYRVISRCRAEPSYGAYDLYRGLVLNLRDEEVRENGTLILPL